MSEKLCVDCGYYTLRPVYTQFGEFQEHMCSREKSLVTGLVDYKRCSSERSPDGGCTQFSRHFTPIKSECSE